MNGKHIYDGPMKQALSLLKKVSAITFGLTLSTSPVLAAAPNASTIFIASMMAAAIGTSGISTALIQWVINPYVSKIHYNSDSDPNNPLITLETLTFFGNSIFTSVNAKDLEISQKRPFSVWKLKESIKIIESKAQNPAQGEIFQYAPNKKFGMLQFKRKYFYVHPSIMNNPETKDYGLLQNINVATGSKVTNPVLDALNNSELSTAGVKKNWNDLVDNLRDDLKK